MRPLWTSISCRWRPRARSPWCRVFWTRAVCARQHLLTLAARAAVRMHLGRQRKVATITPASGQVQKSHQGPPPANVLQAVARRPPPNRRCIVQPTPGGAASMSQVAPNLLWDERCFALHTGEASNVNTMAAPSRRRQTLFSAFPTGVDAAASTQRGAARVQWARPDSARDTAVEGAASKKSAQSRLEGVQCFVLDMEGGSVASTRWDVPSQRLDPPRYAWCMVEGAAVAARGVQNLLRVGRTSASHTAGESLVGLKDAERVRKQQHPSASRMAGADAVGKFPATSLRSAVLLSARNTEMVLAVNMSGV
mmetsp:Transcript_30549/g.58838  ORF Transcript_30549/g.58838 Transcript_30549/m.58838 type:complete len:309 (+) Transcript_30549:1354-2280(+)